MGCVIYYLYGEAIPALIAEAKLKGGGAAQALNEALIDGNEIMELLGIPAGPQIGEAWRHLKELRLERGPLTREEATEELLKWWNARG